MNAAAGGDGAAPSPTLLGHREAICDRFEAAWRGNQRPRIEDYWDDPADPALFFELLVIELAYRLQRGEQPAPFEYWARFPAQISAIRNAFKALPTPAPAAEGPARAPGPASAGAPSRADADRNLLFGVLALQTDFITREALIAAVRGWVLDRSKPLDQVLVEQGALAPAEQALLERLIRSYLERHGSNPEQSLAAIGAGVSAGPLNATCRGLAQVVDRELQESLYVLTGASSAETLIDSAAPALASIGAPTSSGLRFRILRSLARGGLGEVFVARDEELRREVALKAIQPIYSAHRDSRYRFLLEAEITGRLEHPGIIPVYGLGQDEAGCPFYAMRLIRGESLKDAIARFHQEERPGRDPRQRALGLRELLRRFVDVCNAIAYAHSRGVLHRDLKPSNVMLGPFGETLVVDWGLAKTAGRPDGVPHIEDGTLRPESARATDSTLPGARLGTPSFMSPEQAAGEIDRLGPASDVYSLGATLYSLLTGKPPFDDLDVFTTLHKVQQGDFAPPRSINRRVPPALDAICRKAMALKIDDRYPTPRALADDIEHWLADEMVPAYREPPIVWLARWGRRHRPLVVGAAVLLVTALGALSVSTVLIGREAARREVQRRLAEENFEHAREAVDQMLTEVAEVELADVPQMLLVRKTLLERARGFYQGFLNQRRHDPSVRREAGRAHLRLGEIEHLLGDQVAAERDFRQGIAMLDALVHADPSGPDPRRDLARGKDGLGILLKKAHRFKESETHLRAALELREHLAREHPQDPADRQGLADGRYHLAVLMARLQGRHPEDETAYREAVRMQESLVARARGRPEHRRKLARYLNNLGLLLAATARSGEAEDDFREAIAILERLVAADPPVAGDRWQLARTDANLAVLLQTTGRIEEAEVLSRNAHALEKALRADFPDVPDYRHELASILNNLGLLRHAAGRPADAERAFREAVELQEVLVAEFPRSPDYRQALAVTRLNLASVLEPKDTKDSAEATRTYREALAIQERLTAEFPEVPEYRLALGRTLYSLARLLVAADDLAGARVLLGRAIAYHRDLLADDPRNHFAREFLRDDHAVLCMALIRAGAAAQAADAADELPRIMPDDAREHLRAAAFLTECAASAAAETDRKGPEEAYIRRAIDVLRRAVARNLIRDPKELQIKELTPLRARAEFQELRRKLEDQSRIRPG